MRRLGAKSLGPDEKPCDRASVGLLSRRPVHVAAITYIGKESNKFEEVQAGFMHELEDVLTEYPDPELDPFKTLVVPVLRRSPVGDTAKANDLSDRTIKRIRAGEVLPHLANRAKLTAYAARLAREQLRAGGIKPPLDDYAALAAYLRSDARASGRGV